MMNKGFLLFLIYLSISFVAHSQTAKYSNEFMSLGVGARGLAMSGAVVASTSDVFSSYWNPAGLVFFDKGKSLAFMHSEYFAGIAKYDFVAYSSKVGANGALAFSMIRFGVDNIPNTSQLIDAEGNIDYNMVTSFSAADLAMTASYANKSKIEGLSYGFNARIIRRVAGDFAKSWGFGIDAGAIFLKNNWRFGAMFKDITTTYNSWNYSFTDQMIEVFTLTGNQIPISSTEITLPSLTLGLAYHFDIGKNFSLLSELNAKITSDGKRNVVIVGDPFSVDPIMGLEFDFKDLIFLRAGIGNIQKETVDEVIKTSFQPNIGIGIIIKKSLIIDYALTDIGNQSIALYSNVFSVKLNFYSKTQRDNIDLSHGQ